MNYDVFVMFLSQAEVTITTSGGIDPSLVLEVLTPSVDSAPGSITIALAGGQPDQEVEFFVDGLSVHVETADNSGGLEPISIPIPDRRDAGGNTIFGRGMHELTAQQAGSISAAVQFEIERNPPNDPRVIVADSPPVAVIGRARPHGTLRWVLQDLMPGGLGSWVMPLNPKTWDGPPYERDLSSRSTTAPVGGQFHIYESADLPVARTFSGYCPTAEMREKLEAYGDLNRRFYLFDHRNQVWVVTFTNVELEPLLVKNWNGDITAEGHDYKVTAMIYNRDPLEAP